MLCLNERNDSKLRSNLLVHDVESQSVTSTLNLGDQVTKLLDSFHLLTKELSFNEITEMSISFAVTGLVEIKKTLVDCFLQLKSSLHGLKWSAPLHAAWLGNILEDDTSSSLGLVLHQLHPVGTFLVRALLEEGGKSRKSLVITVEVRGLEKNICEVFFCIQIYVLGIRLGSVQLLYNQVRRWGSDLKYL